jgi:hypothetical protein
LLEAGRCKGWSAEAEEGGLKDDALLDVGCVGVDALDRLALLGHHVRKLREDGPELGDRRLDRLDRGRARLDVVVLRKAGGR